MRIPTLAAITALVAVPALAQQPDAKAERPAPSPLRETIYQGWRASALLDQEVHSKAGDELGQVRNLVLNKDGKVEALLLEGIGTLELPEFIFRVPWEQVQTDRLPSRVLVDITDARDPRYGVFSGKKDGAGEEEQFRVTQVIGDDARLQPGYRYGYVSDVVFDQSGKSTAVLVSRDWLAGGGTFAFPFTGVGKWDPDFPYYGLPYVTLDQANASALKIDLRKFKTEADAAPGAAKD